MNMRKRLIAGIIVGLSTSSIGIASVSASAATAIGASAASTHASASPANRKPPPGRGYGSGGSKKDDPGWGCGDQNPGTVDYPGIQDKNGHPVAC